MTNVEFVPRDLQERLVPAFSASPPLRLIATTTRDLAEYALEEFLEHSHASVFIENRLFSKALPESALWRGEGPRPAGTGGGQSTARNS